MNKELMFSSNTPEWATPQDLFDRLDALYHFDLDAAATPENAKCARFFTKEDDGLLQMWGGVLRMVQSSIRPRDRRMGPQGIRGGAGAGNDSCHASTGADRHSLVSRLLQARRRDIPARTPEIRRRAEQRAVSQHDC